MRREFVKRNPKVFFRTNKYWISPKISISKFNFRCFLGQNKHVWASLRSFTRCHGYFYFYSSFILTFICIRLCEQQMHVFKIILAERVLFSFFFFQTYRIRLFTEFCSRFSIQVTLYCSTFLISACIFKKDFILTKCI